MEKILVSKCKKNSEWKFMRFPKSYPNKIYIEFFDCVCLAKLCLINILTILLVFVLYDINIEMKNRWGGFHLKFIPILVHVTGETAVREVFEEVGVTSGQFDINNYMIMTYILPFTNHWYSQLCCVKLWFISQDIGYFK